MIKIEINLCNLHDGCLGINWCEGQDEIGEFKLFTIGFLFFTIDIHSYEE